MPVLAHGPYWQTRDEEAVRLYHGDVIQCLRCLQPHSVQCVVTSPPYWSLRDYGADKRYEIGCEPTVGEYVAKMVEVFREVRRVLRDDGTCWLNIGGGYTSSGSIDGSPWRVAFALEEDGWILRQDCVWSKTNPLPDSVKDRCTKSHEYIFLLVKGGMYYYDSYAVRTGEGGTANMKSVWSLPLQKYPGLHFATFPLKLIEPMILAGTSEHGCCVECETPYKRIVQRIGGEQIKGDSGYKRDRSFDWSRNGVDGNLDSGPVSFKTLGWGQNCQCVCDEVKPCVVLDPFIGSGTTAVVSLQLCRSVIGIDLKEEYLRDHVIDRVKTILYFNLHTSALVP